MILTVSAEPPRRPFATYRLQFSPSFTFRQAAELADYFAQLGVSHCYASPIFAARPGSTHGYDVTDPTRINPEMGGEEGFGEFVSALRQQGLGLIMDVVPNHMCISHPSNCWWWDVLENGPSSPYARFFDVDWRPPKAELADKVLLPVLGDQYGRVLENQQLTVRYADGAFVLSYGELRLPLAPRSWFHVLAPLLERARSVLGESHEDVLELESILTALEHLPPRTETDPTKLRERLREKQIIKKRLARLMEGSLALQALLTQEVEAVNGRKGDPRSFDRLERMLADQAYRLAYWRVAADEINYRRFFDINDYAAIRVEDAEVFAATHWLVGRLVASGAVQGLRVDHPDGLFEPEKYFRDLHALCRSDPNLPFYIVAEKILLGDEALRPGWQIQGTTGYGFLNTLNGLFVAPEAKTAFGRLFRKLTGRTQPFADLVYECKRLIMAVSLCAEWNVLARRLDQISEQHRWSRDFTLESLREALREVVACFPIYRTYISSQAERPDPEDERHIRHAIADAKKRNPAIDESVFDFIQSVLLLEDPEGLDQQQREERRLFVMRLQQYTGPVMAKGLEDTAFYRYHPLASLNEVGGEPEHFGVSASLFHRKNAERRRLFPYAMLATSTHDTKRSEDVRARLNALSEIPREWSAAVQRWRRWNQSHKQPVGGVPAPSVADEYLLYQTLLGVWPFEPLGPEQTARFTQRIQDYMQKAAREAKAHTSWISPNTAYEDALRHFVAAVLAPEAGNRFLSDFLAFQAPLARAGMLNSLSQVVLKITSPGVPDFYQGTELWDFSLVDPDNRSPVDFALRRRLLERLQTAEEPPAELLRQLLARPGDGALKLYVTWKSLQLRKWFPELFCRGSYSSLRAEGARSKHVVAFARQRASTVVLALAGRFFLRLPARDFPPVGEPAWADTVVLLPRRLKCRLYRDVFSGELVKVEGRNGANSVPLARAFAHLPVALLISSEADARPAAET